jgi:poly-beta-1,6-N-acetyl-D-glucosamine synthase
MGMALLNHRRDVNRPPPRLPRWPAVSVLVPAYNEGETIDAAIESLVGLDYPRYEVIVVDDGSRDETLARARKYVGSHHGRCTVRVLSKPNGGKWSALNYGFRHAASELLLCVDADSRLGPDALTRLVGRMADPGVSAVAGQVRVRNRVNLLTRLQGLEYVISNGLVRAAQSLWGCVLVVPGPIGLFRRSALEELFLRYGAAPSERPGGAQPAPIVPAGGVPGPFESDTFAEDFDLSLAILSLGGRIVYEPLAVSHTKAPQGAAALLNQRYRWCRGTIQVLRKFLRRARRSPELLHPRLVAWLTITYLMELVVMPAAACVAVCLLGTFLASGGDPVPLLGWAAAFLLVNLNATAFFTDIHGDTPGTLAVLPVYDLYHSFLLNGGWVIAVVDELRGSRMRW